MTNSDAQHHGVKRISVCDGGCTAKETKLQGCRHELFMESRNFPPEAAGDNTPAFLVCPHGVSILLCLGGDGMLDLINLY